MSRFRDMTSMKEKRKTFDIACENSLTRKVLTVVKTLLKDLYNQTWYPEELYGSESLQY